MNTRKIKKVILQLLAEDDLAMISATARDYAEKDLINSLFSALFRPEERIRWHAVTLFGQVLPRMADQDMEAARIVMRRFLWSLNDESGGIGWGAPEAMAEVMLHHRQLAKEYLHMLLSYLREDGPLEFQDGNYLELPELQRGLLWGVGRLAPAMAETLIDKGVIADLLPYLMSVDGPVRGTAAWCLGLLQAREAVEGLQIMQEDPAMVRLYLDGEIREFSVGRLATEALLRIVG